MTSSDGVGILDADRLLKEWRWLCPMRVTIIDCNAYGDLFVRDDLGRIHMLDVGSGEFALVAESASEFDVLKATPEKREEWFAEADAHDATERGLIPGPGKCIAFDIPTVFAESAKASPYIADIYDQVGFLGDMHRQLSKFPDDAKVNRVIKPEPDTD